MKTQNPKAFAFGFCVDKLRVLARKNCCSIAGFRVTRNFQIEVEFAHEFQKLRWKNIALHERVRFFDGKIENLIFDFRDFYQRLQLRLMDLQKGNRIGDLLRQLIEIGVADEQ